MTRLTKTLHFEDDVLDVIRAMTWEQRDGAFAGVITAQLDRALYVRTNKALAAMGGKWDRRAKAHLFPTDPRPHVTGLLEDGELVVEKDGYFVTPHEIGVTMALMAELIPGRVVLEPSAGTGELAEAILDTDPTQNIICGEKNADRVDTLLRKGFHAKQWDFLAEDVRFERIVQNPPFEKMQDVDHVLHAYDCLTPGGILVSVMSESPFFRNDEKAVSFRCWLDLVEHEVVSLEAGAFQSSGTGVKTRIVKIRKDQ
jgi:hypothetical protein